MGLGWLIWPFRRLTIAFIIILSFVLAVGLTAAIPRQNETSHIISIYSPSQFDSSLKHYPFSFVKFFSPLCPHCQEMATAFLGLCSQLRVYNVNESTPSNHTVGCLEVDVTKRANGPLADRFKVDGVPMLFLISGPSNDTTAEEYPGQRTTSAMYDFIISAIALHSSPLVPHFETLQQVKDFIHTIGDRALVLSVIHDSFQGLNFFSDHLPLPENEWLSSLKALRKQPSIRFGTVSTPYLLLLPSCSERFRIFSVAHATLPIAFAAARASTLCDTGHWFFPGIQDGQSLSSFIHTSIVPPGSFTVLTFYNARHIFHSDRPLLFVFGLTDVPTGLAAYRLQVLSGIMKNSSILTVYAKAANFPGIINHVSEVAGATKFINSVVGGRNTSEVGVQNVEVFSYRDSNRRPSASHLHEMDVEEWGRQQIATIGKATVVTRVDAINRLTSKSWAPFFEYDRRSVLLLLHRSAHRSHLNILSNAARLLHNDAGTLVVATFDEGSATRPAWPNLTVISQLPELVLITPGQSPILYHGIWTSRAIARFARNHLASPNSLHDGIVWEDVALAYMFVLGLLSTITGTVILLKKLRRAPNKRIIKKQKHQQDETKNV